ncbi:response regulator [Heliobacterium undosum]|uniref:Stage 0 sporulation protein A homolog n=1 Tax=Heliomicrobium undosum TaxID=121734 RepID=A0A845L4N2_9FIRM|nr:response regulator transcription factor [Heliomicrobium undosum]MZP29804.1 response regulator [Heliomicrobium undosum]
MAAKRILIADDELRMRKLVGDFLKKKGFLITEAEDGKAALELFFSEPFDLVILDVMMPGYDGWAVCREIRKQSRVPVIMLTAKAEEVDELFGFDLGADEYVTKPFSPRILVARVQALLRRLEDNQKDILTAGDLAIDVTGRIVTVKAERIDLTPKEFDLLLHLAENAGKALSREQVLNAVWDYDYFGDARTVDTHVKKLRLKLGDAGRHIQTVRGLGYRFEVQP